LTFESALVDVEEAFAPGQVYVALSRIRTLEGLFLKRAISEKSISIHPMLTKFIAEKKSYDDLEQIFEILNNEFIKQTLTTYFECHQLTDIINVAQISEPIKRSIVSFSGIAEKFLRQLESILSAKNNVSHLSSRLIAASDYFIKQIIPIVEELKAHLKKIVTDPYLKRSAPQTRNLIKTLENKSQQMKLTKIIGEGLATGLQFHDILLRESFAKKQPKVFLQNNLDLKNLSTESQTLALFRSGKSVHEIAAERRLATNTVENHLASFLVEGKVLIEEIVGPQHLSSILHLLQVNKDISLFNIKLQVDTSISLGQIQAAMVYAAMTR